MIEELQLIDQYGHDQRKIWVYLPKGYKQSKKKYPVLYMLDGHNLFYDHVATYGTSWGLKEFLDIHKHEVIVVGMDCNHKDNQRLNEYSPFDFKTKQFGKVKANAKQTLNWIINIVKPFIDAQYRTLANRQNTSIAGSSMGGLMAYYSTITRSDIFYCGICMSSSFEFNPKECIKLVEENEIQPNTRILLHIGSDEFTRKQELARYMNTMLTITNKLLRKKVDVYSYLVEHGKHNESAWNKELPIMIQFLIKQ